MKKLLVIVACAGSLFVTRAQNPSFQWAKSFGAAGHEYGNDVAGDFSGNVLTTGTFSGTVDFDPGAGVTTLTASGYSAIFISKLDAAGNLLWAKGFGGTSFNDARGIVADALGNVYTIGSFQGVVDLDPGAGTYTVDAPIGARIFILKLDASGNFVWAKDIGGTSTSYGYNISLDATGNIYCCGSFYGTTDFDPGAGTVNIAAAANEDAFILKLNASGNYVWAGNMGGPGYDRALDIKADATGNIYATGYFEGIADFDPGTGTYNLTTVGNADIFIMKVSSSGNFMWAGGIGGYSNDAGFALTLDGSGNVYSTGQYQQSADFDPGVGTFSLTSGGGYDIYILKLNGAGNFAWAKGLPGPNSDGGTSIRLDASGNIYTSGNFQGTVDFDPGPGNFYIGSTGGDVFIHKLDASGNFSWVKSFGSTGPDYTTSMDLTSSGAIFTIGYFSGTGDFDPETSVLNLSSIGGNDVFVHKLQICLPPALPSYTGSPANLALCSGNSTTLSVAGTGTINWYPSPSGTTAIATGTTFITPSLSAGTYTYYVEAQTCAPSASRTAVTITVNALPNITVSGTSSVICIGETLSLTAQGAASYTWSTLGTTSIIAVSPTVITTYTLKGLTAMGCSGTQSITIAVNPLPTISIVSSNSMVCTGETVSLTASGASTYIWAGLTTGSVVVVNPLITTTYSLIGTNENSCTEVSFITQVVDPCAGIRMEGDPAHAPSVKVYPNPNTGSFTIECDETSQIQISNSLGQIIFEETRPEGKHVLELKEQANGIYFIKTIGATRQGTGRIQKY